MMVFILEYAYMKFIVIRIDQNNNNDVSFYLSAIPVSCHNGQLAHDAYGAG